MLDRDHRPSATLVGAGPTYCEPSHEEVSTGMIVASGPWIIVTSIGRAFANVAFTGSLIVTVLFAAGVVLYAKRRPVGASLSWGEAMAAAVYATFGLFWAFGVVPHQWLAYSQGPLAMRSDAILAGPGSTGWLGPEGIIDFPVVITKATLSDFVAVNIYGVAFVGAIALWAVWQGRGDGKTDEIETSAYGRPLVKV